MTTELFSKAKLKEDSGNIITEARAFMSG